jgi:hypothetical protein
MFAAAQQNGLQSSLGGLILPFMLHRSKNFAPQPSRRNPNADR